jgi:hypothetical protein
MQPGFYQVSVCEKLHGGVSTNGHREEENGDHQLTLVAY